jgi:leucyl aminopeptidase
MTKNLTARGGAGTVPIVCLDAGEMKEWLAEQKPERQSWVETTGFKAKPGRFLMLPGAHGQLDCVVFGLPEERDAWLLASLAQELPSGRYSLESNLSAAEIDQALLGWALSGYSFDRFQSKKDRKEEKGAVLVWPKRADRARVEALYDAIALTRDLINTPANHMGPAELAEAVRLLAKEHKAKVEVTEGEQLLKKNYPSIYEVGKASTRAPRLIDLTWGKKGPLVTLVGKGVCFDSGGLDLKPSAGMLLMKKDMGGSAHVLGLASFIMARKLPLRLRVLIPAVENSVSGNAFRPLDVIQTRKGMTVEVGNTDAEGRLVLSDALTEACSAKPDLLVDFATLTGAARVALGTDLPALFCNDEGLVASLLERAEDEGDPLWRLPLHKPYRKKLESKVADINNVSPGGYGGAITAALFLQEFVDPGVPWAHIDLMAWNLSARPGRPVGGEAMGLRTLAAHIESLCEDPKKKRNSKSKSA